MPGSLSRGGRRVRAATAMLPGLLCCGGRGLQMPQSVAAWRFPPASTCLPWRRHRLRNWRRLFRPSRPAAWGQGGAGRCCGVWSLGPVLRLPVRGRDGRGRVTIRFATPTELKSGGEVWQEPEFGVLIGRLAERVWTLGRLEGLGLPGFAGEGPEGQADNWEWHYRRRERRSSRTGQRHPLGGFMGTATYEGPVGCFCRCSRSGAGRGWGGKPFGGRDRSG
jgi:hypothetical protein